MKGVLWELGIVWKEKKDDTIDCSRLNRRTRMVPNDEEEEEGHTVGRQSGWRHLRDNDENDG